MILKDLMIKDPITVRPDDSLYHASQLMGWIESRHLPVTVGDNRLVGILSERDILSYRVKEPDYDPRGTPVASAMHSKPQTAAPDSSLSEAAGRLAMDNIGCLPVTEKGKLIGLVTRRDVLSAEVRESMASPSTTMTVADVMTRDPICVGPDDYVLDAAKKMSDTGVRHLPVVDSNGRAVGILSDRDIQMVILDPEEFARSTDNGERPLLVGDVMSRPPLRVWASENCGTVAALFVQFRASAAPVVAEDGTLEGVVSYVDLLRSIPPASSTAGPATTTP